jgi:heme oxygenase (mycobilin-producing)
MLFEQLYEKEMATMTNRSIHKTRVLWAFLLGTGGCTAANAEAPVAEVTLINSFELTAEQRAAFPTSWDAVAEYMRAQPGFIDAKLHELVGPPDARFQFVNVAHWASSEDFEKAMSSDEFVRLTQNFQAQGDFPGLFRVVRDLGPKAN